MCSILLGQLCIHDFSLNKNYDELKTLSDEKCDNLIKTYDQLQLVTVDEIPLVSNRMLSFIDHRLLVINQVHEKFMSGLDVIMIDDFYQVSPIQDSWIFKLKTNGFDILKTNFLHENVKCCELKQVMQQNDLEFINILNRFQTTSQAYEDINFINKICCK